jgi:hypothetical protein
MALAPCCFVVTDAAYSHPNHHMTATTIAALPSHRPQEPGCGDRCLLPAEDVE